MNESQNVPFSQEAEEALLGALLVNPDADEAGEKAAQALGAVSSRVKRVTVPQGKDLTDFALVAGDEAVRRWFIEAVL